MNRIHLKISTAVAFSLFVCLAFSALPVCGEQKPGEIVIPTVYRDAYKITVSGKPDANGTFSMVFTPHGEDGTEFGLIGQSVDGDRRIGNSNTRTDRTREIGPRCTACSHQLGDAEQSNNDTFLEQQQSSLLARPYRTAHDSNGSIVLLGGRSHRPGSTTTEASRNSLGRGAAGGSAYPVRAE